ncbi:MAG: DUF2062 domain-containing protein [Halothiobacillus sp.]|jgi:uncharacterized protein (DUF2062 family)|nr:DUF2062 domain-containing protein [Halothiobacillus sp.]
MPRRFFRKWAPSRETVLAPSFMRPFSKWLVHPNLWHFNRRSVSGGVAIGLFIAFLPTPFQMVWAAIAAVLVRVNVALAVAMVLLTNPLTMLPVAWAAFMLGTWYTGQSIQLPAGGMTVPWILDQLRVIWLPLLLGLLTFSILSAVVSYTMIQLLWRWQVIRHKQRKRAVRQSKTRPEPSHRDQTTPPNDDQNPLS